MALLPGQPIQLQKGPVPQLGSGIYSRDGQVRASLVGVPTHEGSVRYILHVAFHTFFSMAYRVDTRHLSCTATSSSTQLGGAGISYPLIAVTSDACDHSG